MLRKSAVAALFIAVSAFAAVPCRAEERHVAEKSGIIQIGEPVRIGHDALEQEANHNTGLREYLDKYGRPDYAEVQEVVVQKPWAAYEVHLYYLRRMRHVVFGRAEVSPAFTDFGIRKFDERITPEMLARLLGPAPTPEPTPRPTPVIEHRPPLPPVATKKIVLRGVYFDFDKSEVREDARPVLDEGIRVLKEQGDAKIAAAGHTDNAGSEEYNQQLSVRRAEAVRNYLVAGGIAPDRIRTTGFGETLPVASNETEDGRAQNRRVELHVVQE